MRALLEIIKAKGATYPVNTGDWDEEDLGVLMFLTQLERFEQVSNLTTQYTVNSLNASKDSIQLEKAENN